MYEMIPAKHDMSLFFRMEGEAAERHGAIGHLRMDFGKSGNEFYSTWFDKQPHLKSAAFKAEFDTVINALRDDGDKPPLANRGNLKGHCNSTPGKDFSDRGAGYMVQTLDYSYYFRCRPSASDYDVYCFAYDNHYLLPELEGKHELPTNCFSLLPSSGELIFLVMGENFYIPTGLSTPDPALNRQIAVANNALLGVSRAQEEAMLAGSLFGWDKPAAKPWNYEQDGSPRQQAQPPKRDIPER